MYRRLTEIIGGYCIPPVTVRAPRLAKGETFEAGGNAQVVIVDTNEDQQ